MKITLPILLLCWALNISAQQPVAFKQVLKLMGCRFELTAIATDELIAKQAVEAGIAEISRIEKILSEWDSTTQTSLVNKMAGITPVKVDKELYDIIYRSQKVSALSAGAFDISFAAMDKIWNFDKAEHSLPDSAVVKEAAKHVNYQNIILNKEQQTVYLKEKGMKIGFGAIGKGYAANKAKALMQHIAGVKGGVVNASGDLIAWGQSNHPDGWSVQIANPTNKSKPLAAIRLNNMAIVTSGNYEKYFKSNGLIYAHIIDPRTGYPTTDIKSATVLSPDAELCDALATAISVMGVEKGLALINKLNNVECIMIDSSDKIHTSDKMQLNYIH